ncbi:FCD domain-containing protein [Kalamiella sp. sgz302252]|uniref:FCD domain-containing protein n=1 Tax=Pantoea sp. sgz302252 TaxID=3341827 RepID=UPI0036D3AAA0
MSKTAPLARPYQEVGEMLQRFIREKHYGKGERLPAEREIAALLKVSRTLVREALIMLELEGWIEVRRGAGIFVVRDEDETPSGGSAHSNAAGPFELLQARQLLESNIAEFAALQATPEDILKMRQALKLEEHELASGAVNDSENGDRSFHLAIAQATHNSLLVELFKQSWQWREDNIMWQQLHRHLRDTRYRQAWLDDHKQILVALVKRDAAGARRAMWQHLENVKQRLLEFSDVDALDFDGYLFASWPLDKMHSDSQP